MPGIVVFAQEKVKEAPKPGPEAEVKAGPKEETGTKEDAPSPKPTAPNFEIPMILGGIFFIFYFLVLRPQKRRQERERQEQQNLLNKNDKVITTAGIYGTII